MAKKKVPEAVIKLQVTGGQANPAPPVGPALSQHGVNIGQFISQFNEKTSDRMGVPLPVLVRVYKDRSFDFEVKQPPASYLVKRAAEVAKGAENPSREVAGFITPEQVREIAEQKMKDLNTNDVEAAMRIVEGTARSCGIAVGEEGEFPQVGDEESEPEAEKVTDA